MNKLVTKTKGPEFWRQFLVNTRVKKRNAQTHNANEASA
jgi:hypothetical protein